MARTIIRGALVVDGTGSPAARRDVAVAGDRIAEVGEVGEGGSIDRAAGDIEIDATGLIVTPGFVDLHTHFDGQITWDSEVRPSSLHGVTSIAVGNCGVGFAPAAPDRHDWLIGLLEGVEDIPGTALAEGLTWDWETFPDYLDALDRRRWTVDVGAHVPHAAVRTYVMGERGADHRERPAAQECERMAALVAEGIAAGAVGFATSRTDVHRTNAGHNIGTLSADADELLAIAGALRRAGGVIQLISDLYQTTDDDLFRSETDLLRRVVEVSGRPLSFTMQQAYHAPERWRAQMAWVDSMVDAGHDVKAQVAARPIGVLLGLAATANPFMLCASYGELAALPVAQRAAAMRGAGRRERILAEHAALTPTLQPGILAQLVGKFEAMFRLSDPVDYDLRVDESVAADAARRGIDAAALTYDALSAGDGDQLLYFPLFNFADGDMSVVHRMLASPNVLLGLSDAGAHCGAICDASMPTSSLTMWARDRSGEHGLPIERIVHLNTQRNARHLGWADRGVVAPGHLADLNLIDLDRLACHPPRLVNDLPAGGRRLVQDASGYVATVKSGVITQREGCLTGETPGRLVRGARS